MTDNFPKCFFISWIWGILGIIWLPSSMLMDGFVLLWLALIHHNKWHMFKWDGCCRRRPAKSIDWVFSKIKCNMWWIRNCSFFVRIYLVFRLLPKSLSLPFTKWISSLRCPGTTFKLVVLQLEFMCILIEIEDKFRLKLSTVTGLL